MSGRSFLWDTPPHCPTPACYVHDRDGIEHHVEGCPVYDTNAQAIHRLGHGADDAARAINAAMAPIIAEKRKTWRGRLDLLVGRIRYWWLIGR